MFVVSIVNQKGGVARTTTCANLGACLALRGFRTLLVDLDPQANLTLGLRDAWPDLPYGLHDVLLAPEASPLSGIVRQIGDLPLFLAPGHWELSHCETTLAQLGGCFRLRRAFEGLLDRQPFDWVLVDCPPALGQLTQNAIVASTHMLVPTEPNFYALAGMDLLNRTIVGLIKDLRVNIKLLGVLLTFYQSNTNLHRTIGAEIRERYGDNVFETVIHKNARLAEAEVEGQPIVLFDKHSRGAKNYESLTDEILMRIQSL